MRNLTISAERDDPRLKISLMISDESTMDELAEVFRTIALGLGYTVETVNTFVPEVEC